MTEATMTTDIFYSIIIPHYNSLDTLPRTLNSIPVRDDVEVLVIDNSPEPVKREQIEGVSRGFTLLYSDNTKGAGHARNMGLDHAKGKWLVFADADDFFTEDFNAVLDKYKDTDWDVVMFPIRSVDSVTLELSGKAKYYNETIFNNEMSDRYKLLKNITPWSRLVSHRLVKEHNIRHGETPVSNDVIFNAYVAVFANKILINKEQNIYVLTHKEGSLTTRQSDEMWFIRTQVRIQRQKIYKENGHGEWEKNYFPYNEIYGCGDKRLFWRYVKLLYANGMIFTGSLNTMYKRGRCLLGSYIRLTMGKTK